ncbi:MAG: hypothetical protein ABJC10_02420 [Acidobacteriota bacterium]
MPPTKPLSHTVAYAANIDSLKSLELSAERDEGRLLANIKKVQLATDDGAKATAMTYNDVDDFDMGHLTFVSYTTDVDKESHKAIHKTQGETFLCEGKAYVADKVVQVLVFREKPSS